jgi:hypothetical protein
MMTAAEPKKLAAQSLYDSRDDAVSAALADAAALWGSGAVIKTDDLAKNRAGKKKSGPQRSRGKRDVLSHPWSGESVDAGRGDLAVTFLAALGAVSLIPSRLSSHKWRILSHRLWWVDLNAALTATPGGPGRSLRAIAW